MLKKNCYTTSILVADIDYEELNFKKFFTPSVCVNELNEDNEFNGSQSGGRITPYKDNKLLLTVGDYRFRKNAQDKKSIFGKTISIDMSSKKVEILSMGHRNPQGLYYDKLKDVIYTSEHGPQGGDEVNIIPTPKKNGEIINFGWAISSYGEHYGGKNKNAKKYPLHKSHKDYGFVEPLINYVPSIGASEILKVKPGFFGNSTNQIIVGSMRAKSIFHYDLGDDFSVLKENKIEIGERIRDIIYSEKLNKYFLFLENTTSIGIMSVK